ncbi:glycosyltransferase family 2 protein [Candidatus Sumerlaeota bacterium]|nr:glycosyltransferase family 2 protein [Candidatus Sumerlaeota bacterium]
MTSHFSIIIPNWNGEDLIVRCVSSLLLSARTYGKDFECIVVDDASTDNSCEILKKTFPEIRLIRNEQNRGFGYSVNRGMEASGAPIAILANNDIVAREDFIPSLLKPFEGKDSERLFGVSAKTVNWTDGAPNHLNMTAHFAKGLVNLDYEDSQVACSTLFLQGGACALRRDAFLELGAFSPLYHPGYWEDYDLSYRAAKMGYRMIYEPRALAYHLGKGSLLKVLGKEGISGLTIRNQFYFTWLNITDGWLLAGHFLLLPFHLLGEMISGKPLKLTRGFLKAAPHFSRVLKERKRRRIKASVSDRTLLKF